MKPRKSKGWSPDRVISDVSESVSHPPEVRHGNGRKGTVRPSELWDDVPQFDNGKSPKRRVYGR
jgi:hypothetical protein